MQTERNYLLRGASSIALKSPLAIMQNFATFEWSLSLGSHRAGTGARAPLGAYTVTQNNAKNAPKHVILTPKIQKFSGAVQTPSLWGGDTPPYTSPLKCPTTTRSWLRHWLLWQQGSLGGVNLNDTVRLPNPKNRG